MLDLTFTVDDKGAPTPLTLAIDQAVIAGWTGRDPVARDKHIADTSGQRQYPFEVRFRDRPDQVQGRALLSGVYQ